MSDFEHQVHDLLADIRAVATAITDPNSGIVQNMELGIERMPVAPSTPFSWRFK